MSRRKPNEGAGPLKATVRGTKATYRKAMLAKEMVSNEQRKNGQRTAGEPIRLGVTLISIHLEQAGCIRATSEGGVGSCHIGEHSKRSNQFNLHAFRQETSRYSLLAKAHVQ